MKDQDSLFYQRLCIIRPEGKNCTRCGAENYYFDRAGWFYCMIDGDHRGPVCQECRDELKPKTALACLEFREEEAYYLGQEMKEFFKEKIRG